MPLIASYIATLVVLPALDFLWVGVLLKDFYKKGLAPYLAQNFTLWAIGLLYVIFAAGVVYLAVVPAQSLGQAMLRGAILGFVSYSLYDLTNIATFTKWPLSIGVVDIFWGTVLSGAAASVGFLVLQFFSK